MLTDKRRASLLRAIGDVSRAAKRVQMESDYQPESYQGRNTTAIDKAARRERQAIRALWKLLGLEPLNMTELNCCQNADEHVPRV